ncbi:MAG: hypothetical protein K0S70_312 [Microbacterium sp.]|jgi:hypothetical protein|nr:hypothetical protein [Microbacterium sp.]MDQ1074857.1 hypothetical protein [Microbacterium sp. SORGH_AS_0969]MDQ1115082.1 hypothetical protein [Microbacterium testaceum]
MSARRRGLDEEAAPAGRAGYFATSVVSKLYMSGR